MMSGVRVDVWVWSVSALTPRAVTLGAQEGCARSCFARSDRVPVEGLWWRSARAVQSYRMTASRDTDNDTGNLLSLIV